MEDKLDIVIDSASAKRGIDVLVQSFSNMVDASKRAETSTTQLFDKMSVGIKNLESLFFNLRSVIASFGTVITVFNKIGSELTKFQAFISALSVSVGTVAEARVQYAGLMEMSNRLGVSVNSLSHNYAQMSAAAVGTSLTQDKLNKTFESFSVASRVLHLSTADTRLMFYALTQMVSKGKVSMEELRRQLGEKLPGAMSIAARSVGATMDQFESAVRKGTVDSAKFLPIFADEVVKTFGGSLPIAVRAFDAQVNILTNSIQALVIRLYDLGVADSFVKVIQQLVRIVSDKAIGDALGKAIKGLADKFTQFLETITPEKVRQYIDGFSHALSAFGNVIITILPAVIALAENLGKIAAAWVVIKGVQIGASIGNTVAGKKGAVIGGVIGGLGGLGAVAYGANKLDEASNKPINRSVSGSIESLPDYMKRTFVGPPAPVVKSATPTLQDVIGGGSPSNNPTSAMNAFIEHLKERDEREGELGNVYDALRDKAKYLAQKEPALLGKAIGMIADLEGRGVEYKSLTDRITGMSERLQKQTPDTIDRQVKELLTRYPSGDSEKQNDLLKAAADFRKEYFDKIAAQQAVFQSKQDEIIVKLKEEQDNYQQQIDLLGKSNDLKDQSLKRTELEKKLAHDIVQLRNEANRNGRTFDENSFKAQADRDIDAVIAKLKDLQTASKSVFIGIKTGLQSYIESVDNMGTSVNQIVTKSFKGMEDSLVEFARTGKLSFKSLADSIISDMVRIAIQQTLTGPLSKLMSTGLDLLFNQTQAPAPVVNLDRIAQMATGTDYVPRDGLAYLHKGEAIVPAAQNNQSKSTPTMTVNMNFTVPAPTDRRTQNQIATMAGLAIQQAIQRNS